MRVRSDAQITARRGFIATLLGACAAKAQTPAPASSLRNFPSAAARYSDPATEFTVLRLTDPQYSSHLGAAGNRNLTTRGMLFASDIGGSFQAYWMDLKKRSFRQLTEVVSLDIDSLSLLPNDRGFYYFDDTGLHEADLGGLRRNREIYRVPSGTRRTSGVSFDDAGAHAAFVEAAGGESWLRLLDLARGSVTTLTTLTVPINNILFRPRHNAVVYCHVGNHAQNGENEMMMVNFDGSQRRMVPSAAGDNQQAQWTTDGASLLYLNRPPDASKLTGLREWTPETGADALIANTSQFVRFHANTNTSVFIGASGSKASPYILLLIRKGRRELTLAEHRASDAGMTAPQFSPNSQAIFFVSDRHGKPAIYWMPVDKLVSETDGS